MKQILLHIGAPRTGTTVIQKHALHRLKNTLYISKKPYSGGAPRSTDKSLTSTYNLRELKNLQSFPSLHMTEDNNNSMEILLSLTQALGFAVANKLEEQEVLNRKLVEMLNSISRFPNCDQILISLERLCDTTASLMCMSTHGKYSPEITAITLLKAIRMSTTKPLVSLCLRSPIPYLRSRYIRNIPMRIQRGERMLTPKEYIQKQAKLEQNYPGTSALSAAMHSNFIRGLQRYAFVKAFGFEELLKTDDLFSLMGLQNEGKYAFRKFPRENKLNIKHKHEAQIERDIVEALKECGLYEKILEAKMFD